MHEWDAKPGLGVQKLDGRYRCVMWGYCSRCGQLSVVHVDLAPSLVLPQSVTQQINSEVEHMHEGLRRLRCPGPPLQLAVL